MSWLKLQTQLGLMKCLQYRAVCCDAGMCKEDTCREASLFMTLCELYIEVGDQGVDVVVPLDLQTEGGREGQFFCLYCVDVYLLRQDKRASY